MPSVIAFRVGQMGGRAPFGMAAGLRPVNESTRLDLQRQIEDFIAGPGPGRIIKESVF